MIDTEKATESTSAAAGGYMAGSEPPTYRIETIADLLTVPADRVDALLVDLRSYLTMVRPLADHLNAAASAATGGRVPEAMRLIPAFTWLDDGAHDVHTDLHTPDGETHRFTVRAEADAA